MKENVSGIVNMAFCSGWHGIMDATKKNKSYLSVVQCVPCDWVMF